MIPPDLRSLIEQWEVRIEDYMMPEYAWRDEIKATRRCIDELEQALRSSRLEAGEAPRCDCGAVLTQCTSCAVADYQAAHLECATCCPKPAEETPAPSIRGEVRAARLALGNGIDGFADVSRARIALQVAEDLLAEATASGQWMVVRKRDTDPPEVWLFAGYDDAAAFFSQAQMQWSETYCCRVAYGPGHPMPTGAAPASAEDGTREAIAAIRTADRLPEDGQRVFIWLPSYLGGYWRESRFLDLRMPGPSFEGYYGPWPTWWMPQPADPEAARVEAPVLPVQGGAQTETE